MKFIALLTVLVFLIAAAFASSMFPCKSACAPKQMCLYGRCVGPAGAPPACDAANCAGTCVADRCVLPAPPPGPPARPALCDATSCPAPKICLPNGTCSNPQPDAIKLAQLVDAAKQQANGLNGNIVRLSGALSYDVPHALSDVRAAISSWPQPAEYAALDDALKRADADMQLLLAGLHVDNCSATLTSSCGYLDNLAVITSDTDPHVVAAIASHSADALYGVAQTVLKDLVVVGLAIGSAVSATHYIVSLESLAPGGGAPLQAKLDALWAFIDRLVNMNDLVRTSASSMALSSQQLLAYAQKYASE